MLGKRRGKDDGKINKRSHAFANSILESLDHLLVFISHQIPLINHYNERFLVFLNKLEDVHVLRFDTTCGVDHQDTNIAMLDGTYRTHYAIKLQIFRNLVLSAYSSRIYEVEVETKLIETRINTVACGACNLGNDITIFADKGVNDATFAHIRPTHHSKAGYAVFNVFRITGFQFLDHGIEQVARSATRCRTNGERIAQAQRVEHGRFVNLLVVVGLIHHQQHRHFGASKNLRHILIEVGYARIHIY